MLVIPPGSDRALRADLIGRATLRSDLIPIPVTVELELRECEDTASIREGAVLRAGRDGFEFLVVKRSPGGQSGMLQDDRPVATCKVTAILAACAPIAERAQRAVVRRRASLGEIYRAFGAQVRIADDFTVETFACYRGMIPTIEIARALQEEAGALVLQDGRIAFKRLAQMLQADPVAMLREESTQGVESNWLERHLLPFAFSTATGGETIVGPSDRGRSVVYRPRADARILNNLGRALVLRRKVESAYAPHVMAGMRLDVAGTPMVVITAAHHEDGGLEDGGGGQQSTKLWLGEVVS